MKRVIHLIITCVAILCMASCASTRASEGGKDYVSFEIVESDIILDCSTDGKKLSMKFDTGWAGSSIYPKGFRKLFPSKKRMNEYIDNYRKLKYDERELDVNPYTFSMEYKVNEFKAGDFDLYVPILEYSPYMPMDGFSHFEGVLGLTAFAYYKNFVIDYPNKRITFEAPPISDDSVPLSSLGNLPMVPIEVDGEQIMAAIDTGAAISILSFPELPNVEVFSEEYEDYIKNFEVKLTEPFDMHYSVKIGNQCFEGVEFLYSTDERLELFRNDEKNFKTMVLLNILGYSFFKDKVIQIDFENMVFRIKQ